MTVTMPGGQDANQNPARAPVPRSGKAAHGEPGGGLPRPKATLPACRGQKGPPERQRRARSTPLTLSSAHAFKIQAGAVCRSASWIAHHAGEAFPLPVNNRIRGALAHVGCPDRCVGRCTTSFSCFSSTSRGPTGAISLMAAAGALSCSPLLIVAREAHQEKLALAVPVPSFPTAFTCRCC